MMIIMIMMMLMNIGIYHKMNFVLYSCCAQAKEVYRESNGQQQVLPLDSIYKQRLPEWNRSVKTNPNVIFLV
jgi:hypothetical protein